MYTFRKSSKVDNLPVVHGCRDGDCKGSTSFLKAVLQELKRAVCVLVHDAQYACQASSSESRCVDSGKTI